MKKRIYKINNKNLVTGNPNEVTKNEILAKENNDGTVELSHRNNGTLKTLGSGGNGGNGGGYNIKYYDVSNLIFNYTTNTEIITTTLLGKVINDNNLSIMPGLLITMIDPSNKPLALGIDENMKLYSNNELKTVKQLLIETNKYDVLLACPELTEEQFYDLTLPTV